MTTLQDFVDKKYYKLKVYPEESGFDPFDLWYDRNLYGKVNSKGEPVYISESNLKMVPGADKMVMVADFVADAFGDMRDYYKRMALMRRIRTSGTVLGNIIPKRGWISVSQQHHSIVEIIYQVFVVSYLRGSGKEDSIINFGDFMNIFLDFMNHSKDLLPITRSSFILSSRCSPMVSGLMIELDTSSHNNDQLKEKVIADPNFSFYKKTAKRFGFKVDKNAPWRLIANVSSPRMQNYMTNYGIALNAGTASNLFQLYYYNSKDRDIDMLRSYCAQLYSSYISAYPETKQIKTCGTGKVKQTKLVRRQELTGDVMDNNYGGLYWLEVYFRIKLFEHKKDLTPAIFEKKLKRMLEIAKVLDNSAASEYIWREVEA